MSAARDAILARVREALRRPADPHVRHKHDVTLPHDGDQRLATYARCLPDPGPDRAAWTARFAAMSQSLRTRFEVAADTDSAIATLRTMAQEERWRQAAAQRHPLIDPVIEALGIETLHEAGHAIGDVDVGFSVCDALVAQTGSVLLTARSAGGRALSVLPPHHVVIATADQLVPDLPTAYRLLRQTYFRGWPSFTTLITGPSRTGDIERILVLGAHGPKKLTVVMIG